MISVGRRANGEATRRDHGFRDGLIGAKSEWMASGQDPRLSPTIFLIEQPPRSMISAHFHANNQFQIFIGGSGKIGPRALRPVVVHYAGAYTAYGPLVAGDDGLDYFTIRTVFETGANVVARSRDRWPDGPRRHATSKPLDLYDTAVLKGLGQPVVDAVLPLAEDGLAATSHALPPGGHLQPIEAGVGEGVFLLVLAGAIALCADCLATHESIYISNDEAFPSIVAGEQGAHLLSLVPPRRNAAYG